MDEKNNFQEKSTKPKTPKSKLPLIIGGIAAGVAVIALSVALILGGNTTACKHDDPTQIVVVSAVAPTCQKTGLTEGERCNLCGTMVIPQKIEPVSEHLFGDWTKIKKATTTEEGIKERSCACGEKETEVIPVIKPSEGLAFTSNGDGTCSLSGVGTCTDTDIMIPAFSPNGDSVTRIGSLAFGDCYRLTSIEIPDSVTSIGDAAFYWCTGLTSIVIGDNVTWIGNRAFSSCTGLTSIEIPDSVTRIGSWAFSGCTGLTSIEIPDSVTSIGDDAFWNCDRLTGVVIPDSVTGIGFDAFRGCTGLTDVYITDIDAWCNISFYDYDSNPMCNGANLYLNGNLVTEVTISDSVNSIKPYTFYGCKSIVSVTIPDRVTSIGERAFGGCTGLTSIEIPDSVTSIDYYAFSGCTGLTSIEIPDSVTSIGRYAFEDCTGLTSITVDEDNTSYQSIDGNLYSKDGKTLIQYAIGKKNTSFTIPDSVTSIDEWAFADCTSLTSVVIPDSVTRIGMCAFRNCSSLTDIKYRGTEEQWNAIDKGSLWNYNTGNYTITYNYKGE